MLAIVNFIFKILVRISPFEGFTIFPISHQQYLGKWYVQAQVPGLLTPGRCGRQAFGRYDDGTVSVHNTGTVDIGRSGLVVELCGVAKGRSPLIPAQLITR